MKKKRCENTGCGKEYIGRSKYCSYSCAVPAMMKAADEIRRKSGPIYEKWKARIEASKKKK